LFASFPRLIAGYHVFRRLSMPRHPPCTLNSLTTFIDHRLPQGMRATYERPTMGQIISRRASACSRPTQSPLLKVTASDAHARLIAKKVLDDSPAKTEKTKAPAGGLSPPIPKYKPGESQSIETCPAPGDTSATQASQNLLLNLYSLVKEHCKEPVKAPYKGA
jgi:hypothetical protein